MKKTIQERIESSSRLNESNGCIEWTKGVNRHGYGRIRVGSKIHLAHRVSYTLHVGPIPEGLLVLHHCDNPKCINPKHLFIGTDQDNSDDKVRKNRHPHGESHGMFGKRGLLSPAYGKSRGRSKNAVFSDAEVIEIRRLYASGESNQKALAIKYGVLKNCISQIITRKSYKDLP